MNKYYECKHGSWTADQQCPECNTQTLEQEIERLRAELAECREDAERYRHVRTNPAMLLHLSNKAFDDAIDAARKGEGDI